MELQGICHKMHVGLKDLSVTDQQIQRANVEYKLILDRAEIDLPFNLGQEMRLNGPVIFTACLVATKLPNHFRKVTVLNVLKPMLHVICAS